MHRRFPGFWLVVAAGELLHLLSPLAVAQSIALRPIGSTGPFVIDGSQILTSSGATVTFEVLVSGWSLAPGSPQLLAAQATIDADGFLGVNALPANQGVDLVPLGYAPPDPWGGDRSLGLYVVTHTCQITGRNCSVGEPSCLPSEGSCLSNSRWIVNACCPLGLVNTDSLASYGWGGVCQCGAVVDPLNPNVNYLGTLRLVVPTNASGVYTISLKPDNGQGDGTYLMNQFGLPIAGVTLLPAAVSAINVPSPNSAPPPHDVAANRFVSFSPAAGAAPCAYQIRLSASTFDPAAVGYTGWVGRPSLVSAATARVVSLPVFRVWNEPVVHVGDCEILPGATYEIRSTVDGALFSFPVIVNTVPRPSGGKDWGDVAGFNDGTQWTPPNGIVNVQDVVVIRNYIAAVPPIPTLQRVNLQAVSMGDSCLNNNVNTADTLAVILALGGQPYPFITDPALCPDCPP